MNFRIGEKSMKKKNKKSVGGRIRTALVIAFSFGIVAASGLYWMGHRDAHITKMDVYVSAPTPINFTDDASTISPI